MVSLVVVLFASLCVKYVPIAVTSAQTSGVWACDVVSYANETMRIYIVMDDGKFIAGTNETGAAVEYEYKVIEGGKIEVVETSGLANDLRVKIEDGNLVFSPSVFGGDKWQKVEKEEAKNIKAILTTPAVIPDEYVDIAE